MNLSEFNKKIRLGYLFLYSVMSWFSIPVLTRASESGVPVTHTSNVKQFYFSTILPKMLDYTYFLPTSSDALPINKEMIEELVEELKDEKRIALMHGYGDFEYEPGSFMYGQDLLLIVRRNDDATSLKPKSISIIELSPYLPSNAPSRKLLVFSLEIPNDILKKAQDKLNTPTFLLRPFRSLINEKINKAAIKVEHPASGQTTQATILNGTYKEAVENNHIDNTRIGKSYFQESKDAYNQHVGWDYVKEAFHKKRDALQRKTEVIIPLSQQNTHVYLLVKIIDGDGLSEIRQDIPESEDVGREYVINKLGKDVKKIGEIHIGADKLKDNNQSTDNINLARVDPIGIFNPASTIPFSIHQVVEHIKQECLKLQLRLPDNPQPMTKASTGYKFLENASQEVETTEEKSYSVHNRYTYGAVIAFASIVTAPYMRYKIAQKRNKK